MKDCKYRLPCGICDKYDMDCCAPKEKECEHDWALDETVIGSFSVANYYVCSKCGEKKSLSLSI